MTALIAAWKPRRQLPEAHGLGLAVRQTSGFLLETADRLGATEFLGYTRHQTEAVVSALVSSDSLASTAQAGDEVLVMLNQTVFYSESGGQVGDTGTISWPKGTAEVTGHP